MNRWAEVEAAAHERYAEQVAIALQAARAAAAAWGQVDLRRIKSSWLELVALRVWAPVHAAQLLVARGARGYVDRVVAAYNARRRRPLPDPVGRLVPERLAGAAADGRPLPTLLHQPATTTLRAIARGATPREAAAVGGTQLDMIVRSEVSDAARVATGVEIAARPQLGYVRMVNPPACARCIILAGKFFRWNAGFQRHPRCDCVHIPADEDAGDDLSTDPRAYFDSLGEGEQNRLFTRPGAQAIRDGADIFRVVNARRGMYSAGVGGRRVIATQEGARRGRRIRLMPEQIYRDAGGNRDEAVRLLRAHGYIR